jgi:hypothetical protein
MIKKHDTDELNSQSQKIVAQDHNGVIAKNKLIWRYIGILMGIYALIFFIPDNIWLKIGVSIPDLSGYPKIVQVSVGLAKFPIGVYIFWITAPLVFAANLALIGFSVFNNGGYRSRISLLRELDCKNTLGALQAISISILFLAVGLFFWNFPEALNARGRISRAYDIYESKIYFALFIGGWISLLMPVAIVILVGEIRIYLTSQRRK